MDRLERFYRMHSMLKHRHFVSTQDFLAELEVSRATFKRDLDYMKDRLHAPIVYDRHHEAYRFDESIADHGLWQLPGLWFNADELRALLTMDRLLGDLQPGVLSELTGPIRKRLKELLESGEHSADDIARRIRILAIGSRKVEPAHFRTLSTALLSRRRLRIRHQRRQDGDVLEREVSAQRLVHYRDNWYLDAWCHTREALRTFGVDAIESVTVVDEPAKDVDDATLERHFASGYGIFSGVETQEAELLFDANRARWVAHETWHPQQTGQLQPDGRYRLRFPYAREPELVMDVLRYGAGVEVISPPTLRASVAKELHAAASRYGKG